MQQNLIVALASLAAGFIGALAAHRVLYDMLARLATHKDHVWGAVVRRTRLPASHIMPLTALLVVSAALDDSYIPHAWNKPFEHAFGLAVIAAVAWALVA